MANVVEYKSKKTGREKFKLPANENFINKTQLEVLEKNIENKIEKNIMPTIIKTTRDTVWGIKLEKSKLMVKQSMVY
jgi:hypothetical protein